jgi:hypothetical protein
LGDVLPERAALLEIGGVLRAESARLRAESMDLLRDSRAAIDGSRVGIEQVRVRLGLLDAECRRLAVTYNALSHTGTPAPDSARV